MASPGRRKEKVESAPAANEAATSDGESVPLSANAVATVPAAVHMMRSGPFGESAKPEASPMKIRTINQEADRGKTYAPVPANAATANQTTGLISVPQKDVPCATKA